ncbi:transcriptional regulator [Kaistia algarum]|uniref:ArsR/SmtB family transcription factor n=1 Tax=Kaistia algarum TaxID=2083279 RepID=UPI000CE7CCC6|nr:metalloregulator ArsR/SmtB family transcription factor [Kaistia algarum]MCX5513315.1 metalloregulator ArsR/SmtB family transcription factor [Kaistia algarum]PPE81232.1 transcriptional regulator [Kaistia algarum]
MDEPQALDAFAALSQETRLKMVRALVRAGPDGLPAGTIAEAVGTSSSSASFHLAHLERAGLLKSRRESRSIVYTADYAGLSALAEFLMRDCCQGHPEVCLPAVDALSTCCPPTKETGHD